MSLRPRLAGAGAPRAHILLVDDDPAICRLAREVLERLGYRVAVARTGPEALQQYGEAGQVDLVILDYHLPGLSGTEVLQALQSLDPQARVLLASGFVSSREQERLRRQGASGVIQKPFRMAELERKIQAVLAGDGSEPRSWPGAPGTSAPPRVR